MDNDAIESQGNPAWNDILQDFPVELHPKLTPHLESWDKGVQERIDKIHSDYKPWEQFIKAGVEPETVNFGLNVLNSLSENPQMVYEAIGKYYGLTPAQAKAAVEESKVEDDPLAPVNTKLADLERQNHLMAQHLLTKHDEEQKQILQQKAEKELDLELAGLKKKYGDFNEDFVLAMLDTGKTGEEAVKAYHQWRDEEVGKYVPKPLFMGSGGGLPNQNVDPTKMTEAQTKDTVIQMLRAAAHQNR